MNTEERLKAIKQRLSAATPGDWIHLGEDDPDSPFWGEIRNENFTLIAEMPDLDDRTEDFNFIAHAKEDVPWLLAEVERLQTKFDQLMEFTLAAGLTPEWVEAVTPTESAPRYYRIIDNYTGQTIGLDDHEEDDPGGIVTYQEITEAQYLEYKALIDEDEFVD